MLVAFAEWWLGSAAALLTIAFVAGKLRDDPDDEVRRGLIGGDE